MVSQLPLCLDQDIQIKHTHTHTPLHKNVCYVFNKSGAILDYLSSSLYNRLVFVRSLSFSQDSGHKTFLEDVFENQSRMIPGGSWGQAKVPWTEVVRICLGSQALFPLSYVRETAFIVLTCWRLEFLSTHALTLTEWYISWFNICRCSYHSNLVPRAF